MLATLRADFPDISISKIRFLEAEGLITPQRAPSGYRRYTESDVERLRYVLSVQREHYLPLKVIREHLDPMDRGCSPQASGSTRRTPPGAASERRPRRHRRRPQAAVATDQARAAGGERSHEPRLERARTQPRSCSTRRGTAHYGRDALTLAIAARRLAEYGIDGRHLRAFKTIRRPRSRARGASNRAVRTTVRQQPRCAGGRHAAGDQLSCGAGADRHGAQCLMVVAGEGCACSGPPAK